MDLNKSLQRVRELMKDGVPRAPETVFTLLTMTGPHAFHDWLDVWQLKHLADCVPDGEMMKYAGKREHREDIH